MGIEHLRSRAPAFGHPARAGSARSAGRRDHDAVLGLQATAGNRATAAALAGLSVQRAPAAGAANNGGVLELEGFDPIPIQGATWSVTTKMTTDSSGQSRMPVVEPARSEISGLVLTRQVDRQSSSVMRLREADPTEGGTLRLDRPSRDGALPATTITLDGVALTSISRTGDTRTGDGPALETITLAVRGLSIAGMGKDRPARGTGTTMQIKAGAEPWPPMAVLSFERGRAVPSQGVGDANPRSGVDFVPSRIRAKLAAGPALSRLSELMSAAHRLELVLRKPDGSVEELHDALIERLASSSEGPDVVEVGFIAESSSSATSTPRRDAGRH